MNNILQFTDAALTYIQERMRKENGCAFRVSVKKTGCSGYSYAPQIITETTMGDIHFTVKDVLNVYIDPESLPYIKGLTIDYVEEKKEGALKQKRLVFVNPNEKSRCGCGESFHV